MEVLTVSIQSGDALAVFGFEEEAEMHLGLQELGAGWRVRETTAGELISILYGPCARVRWVALDPPPEVCRRMHTLFTGLDRRAFLRILAASAPASPTKQQPGRAPQPASDGDGGNPRRAAAGSTDGALGETVGSIFHVPDYSMHDLPALEKASEALREDAGGL